MRRESPQFPRRPALYRDDLFNKGFDSINHYNYYDWPRRHATVAEGTELTVGSTMVHFAYDACFAYLNGDEVSPATAEKPLVGQPDMEARTLLRGQIRLLLTYKSSVDWLFQAGAGEVLISPMYEVQRRRGVKFLFLHKVTRMVASADSSTTEAVEMDEQAHLKVGEYQPLVMVHDLPVWPMETARVPAQSRRGR